MQTERRSAPRQGLNSLVYLDLEPGNGGILLNLSEDGMQISVANRLVNSSEIRFTLRLQRSETISGTGRIAWLSPSGRSAGVHFLSLPEETRSEIRQWLGVNSDTSTAESHDAQAEPAAESPVTEEPPPVAPAPAPPETEKAEAENPQPSPAEMPAMVSSAPVETPETQTTESTVTPPQADAPPPLTPAETAPMPDPALEPAGPVASSPEPADALELLEATVETTEIEVPPPEWRPAETPSADPALADAEPSSLLSLYGIDGSEESEQSEFEVYAGQAPDEPSEQEPIAAGYPKRWTTDHPPYARRARAHARRQAAAHKHPPILLSPIFVPAPPLYESEPPPDPTRMYNPVAAPVGRPFSEQAPATPMELSAVANSATSLPEPPAGQSLRLPGALYLPNYRIDKTSQVQSPKFSWKEFFCKPMPHLSEVFERLEQFGWSLENDWHVWLSLMLLLAGFLALAQKPPMIVLTVAFWFAGAVVISDRRRPRHRARHAPKAGRS